MKTLKGSQASSWEITIYGVPGVGKSTLGSLAPNPIFLDVEGGIERVNCTRYQADDWPDDRTQIKTYDELQTALRDVYQSSFDTVVIDSLSAVEEILSQRILSDNGKNSLAEMPYGQGFEALKSLWALFIKNLFHLKETGKNVICIAHDQVITVENPKGENYDRYTICAHKKSIPLIISKMDGVFFAHYEMNLVSKNNDKKIALGTGRRLLQTTEKPYCIAKNRFNLDESISFTTKQEAQNFFERLT